MKGIGEWRRRVGACPRRMRVILAVAGVLIVVASTVIIHAASANPPQHFPGQYEFGGYYNYPTTVSIEQAFRDHGFVSPVGIRGLRYAADSPGYSWPYAFVAVFSFPCSETNRFVTSSNLHYGGTGPDWPAPDVDVLLFAEAQGWNATDKLARWYYRAVPQASSIYEEVLITGSSVCTTYLTNNN